MPRWLMILLAFWSLGCGQTAHPQQPSSLDVAAFLNYGPDDADFLRAETPRGFRFPQDHGAHHGFKTEWWYVTGNLASPGGHAFGYQLTFFRTAILPPGAPPASDSAWAPNDIFMAHFALTDVSNGRFHFFERFSRAALGLAFAAHDTLHVRLDDWEIRAVDKDVNSFTLNARQDDVTVTLKLTGLKPPILNGEQGLSRKGSQPGNASYYYALTRLRTQGVVRLGEAFFLVAGDSWLDREWGTSALGAELKGWDWFALQLDDGSETMLYSLRRQDGGTDRYSGGTFIPASGTARTLTAAEFSVVPKGAWISPRSSVTYPSTWQVTIPSQGIDLMVIPFIEDQELNVTVRYWEGAVRVLGVAGAKPVTGSGYVELVGYGME